MSVYHVNNDGDVKICRAKTRPCQFELHGESIEQVQEAFERTSGYAVVNTLKKDTAFAPELKLDDENATFSRDKFYGSKPPREVQLDALNGVIDALEEDDATQLVAACGTGKTYMHRQLLRHAMDAEDSNGIGVILTSSIRLAHDTAADLRPTDGYDESLGKFGEDYEVVEVHSGATGEEGRQSVKVDGVISVDRIYKQIDQALKDGKKVVIVSTYDSVNKVQEAQARFEDSDKVEADLLIHDEAHNILGQQKPTTVASDDNDLTAYVGFHNDIPGSLQSRKRLYSTATPIIRETESDKESTGDLSKLVESSLKMQDGDQYERITVYSDDPMVGKVGGFISQSTAIEGACLAKPSYEIRESVLKGTVSKFKSPVVDYTGQVAERSEDTPDTALRPNTYGALVSTLNAMASDSDGEKNPPSNVLAYVGSINQSEGFKTAFKDVAMHESGYMSLDDAQANAESADPEMKRKARMRLLAEHTIVKAAHSRQDSASVKERNEAFKMFEGNAVTSHEWTPHKRVLANVNIFSEGVSISEIDTVVISDDDKLNEKSMTQAIGRSIRVVPGNDVKKYGHVIIPEVKDSSGTTINSSSVNLAAYTATRVERGSTAAKLRGENISEDTSTTFKVFKNDGKTSDRLAKEFAQNSVTTVEDLAVAAEITTARTWLLNNQKGYKDLSKGEQFTLAVERIHEKGSRLKHDSPSLTYMNRVRAHVTGKTASEVQEIARNGKVVSAALATGDISSLNPKIAANLIEKNILKSGQSVGKAEVTNDEKKRFLKEYSKEFALAIAAAPTQATPEHLEARAMLPESILKNNAARSDTMLSLSKGKPETDNVRLLKSTFEDSLNNEKFVEKAYSAVKDLNEKNIPMLKWLKSRQSMVSHRKAMDEAVIERKRNEATRGDAAYSVDSEAVRKTGELKASALRALLAD